MEGSPTPARLVLTDEPCNVPIAGHVSGKGHREFAMAWGEMSAPEFRRFNEAWMEEVLHYLGDGGCSARSSTGAVARSFMRLPLRWVSLP